MTISGGSKKMNKAVYLSNSILDNYDDVIELSVCLTSREATILKQLLQTAYWAKRWTDGYTDELDAWISGLDFKLSPTIGCEGVMDCDDVANCIDTSTAVQSAINIYLQETLQNGGIGNPSQPLPTAILEENLLPVDYSCDNDHRFGMAEGIVNSINEAAIEIFQAVEIATNAAELISAMSGNAPILEIAGTAAVFASWVQDSIFETYEAAWSELTRDEIACEIYCSMGDDCELNFNTIWSIYKDVGLTTPPLESADFMEWFDWIVSLPLETDVSTVKIGGLMGLAVIRFGGAYVQYVLGIRSLKTTVELLADDTSPDWAVLCDCNGVWTKTWDFTDVQDMGDWGTYWYDGANILPTTIGTVIPGTGIQYLSVPGSPAPQVQTQLAFMMLPYLVPRCNHMSIRCTPTLGNSLAVNPGLNGLVFGRFGDELEAGKVQLMLNIPDTVFMHDFISLAEGNVIRAGGRITKNEPPALPDNILITGVTLSGTGQNPFT